MLALLLAPSLLLSPAARADVPAVQYPDLLPPDLPIGGGELRVVTDEGLGALVLASTDIHAEVSAGMARVTIHQVFENPYTEGLEATYLLPLPPDAAVDMMELVVGERTITGEIHPRTEARELYEQARSEGRKASLLEQERDNLFTQSVTGICAGEAVGVTVSFLQEVPLDDGVYRLELPLTVGPRFHPPGQVADAARIATPYAEQIDRDLELTVRIDEGMPVQGLWSDSHDILVTEEAAWGAEVALEVRDRLPNKDMVLEWTLATEEPVGSLLAHRPDDGEDGYLALRLEPQVLEDLEAPRGRELMFVVDSSCSMRGEPYETAFETVMQSLDQMRPQDRFNLVRFSNDASRLFPEPQPATPANVEAASAWLERFEGGGTMMETGIVHALTAPGRPEAMRMVLLLTDGYIGNEERIFQVVEENLGEARVFALGVGGSPNHLLLDGVADMGRGVVVDSDLHDDPGAVAGAFLDRIAHPAMTDLRIDWGILDVREQYPARVPDLWAGRTLSVSARYDTPIAVGDVPTTVTVTGLVDGEEFVIELPVEVPQQSDDHAEVRTLWARRHLAELTRRPWRMTPATLEERATGIAMKHGLVSAYTSLVAVDDAPATCEVVHSTQVPHLLPDGMDPGEAMSGGLLGALGSSGSGTGGGGYGGGGYGSGGYGGLIGAKGVQFGSGGLGSRGSGLGGGGTAEGLAGLGTKGRGSGASGHGGGSGDLAASIDAPSAALGTSPVILGALDKSVIDAVIKRHLNQIRYCYERELQKDPTLKGKVTVKFVIAADGSVSSAAIKSSTLGSDAVEQCLTSRFTKMQFPGGKGGGIVIVSYPFLFAPGD